MVLLSSISNSPTQLAQAIRPVGFKWSIQINGKPTTLLTNSSWDLAGIILASSNPPGYLVRWQRYQRRSYQV